MDELAKGIGYVVLTMAGTALGALAVKGVARYLDSLTPEEKEQLAAKAMGVFTELGRLAQQAAAARETATA